MNAGRQKKEAFITEANEALLSIGHWLRAEGYFFVTPTPVTHSRVIGRSRSSSKTLRDVFGWNRPFDSGLLPSTVLDYLRDAGALVEEGSNFLAKIRFSTLDDFLFVHSSYPTVDQDSVFFGPDTYRFAAFIKNRLRLQPRVLNGALVDIGCGTGAGGLIAQRQLGARSPLILADISPKALQYAWVNCQLAGQAADLYISDVLGSVPGPVGLVVSNPPYLVDDAGRKYRDGGGPLGTALSLRICDESLERLAPGGSLLLYTGVPIIEGRDVYREAISSVRGRMKFFAYEELDPDVFGEELDRDAYASAERLAVVGLDAIKNVDV